MGNEKETQLTNGSHYLVTSLSTRDETIKTRGYFKGYTQLGKHRALTIELDDTHEDAGEIRIIPCHVVASIDIIDQAEPEEEKKKETGSYFG
ncbi:MAG: hypothetical protein KGY76_06990 [Candidatus Thermoplasmatota archaeon]|nr:hypothetical protein [Candidatus Thermoplasmatota archaeon]